MGRLRVLPVINGFNETAAKKTLPNPVDDDLCKPMVRRRSRQRGKLLTAVLRTLQQIGIQVPLQFFGKGPFGRNGFTRLQRDFYQQRGNCGGISWNGTRLRNLFGLSLKHRRQAEQIALSEIVIRGVMAAGALHFHTQERLCQHVSFGGHWRVILSRQSKTRRATEMTASFHQD